MSNKGRYLRGEKWYHLSRDADGNLVPNMKQDEHKMKDINFYLEEKGRENSGQEEVKVESKRVKSKGKK